MKFIERKHQDLVLLSEPFVLPWKGHRLDTFRLGITFGPAGLLEGVLDVFSDMGVGTTSYAWCVYRGITVWPEGKRCKVGLFGIHPDWGSVGNIDMSFHCPGSLNRANESEELLALASKYSVPKVRGNNRQRLAVAAEILKDGLSRLDRHS